MSWQGLEPKVQWDRERLSREYKAWNREQKETYRYWLELGKDLETKPEELEAARFAAARVLMAARETVSPRHSRQNSLG